MKKVGLVLMVVTLAMVGCVYKAPLAQKQNIKIDKTALGLWQAVGDTEKPEKLLVLEYSSTEYIVCFQTEKNSLYFRGYPIKVADKSYVQLQLIGSDEESAGEKDRKYQVIAYSVSGDDLEIRLLSGDIIDSKLDTTEEISKVFIQNKDNPKLFSDPVKFTKFKKAE